MAALGRKRAWLLRLPRLVGQDLTPEYGSSGRACKVVISAMTRR